MALDDSADSSDRPGPARLFAAFLQIALSGFGGVLPFARRELVDRRRWLSAETFNENLALCQTLPGPNIVNLSVLVGSRFAGAAGALAALAGLTLAPFVIVLTLGVLYERFGAAPRLAGAVTGLGAAAAGLVAATAARMAAPLVAARPLSAAPFIAAAFVGVGLFAWPLPWVLAALAPASVALVWSRRG